MSVVAFRKTDNKIMMSCDDQTTFGYNKYPKPKDDGNKLDAGKVFKENGMMIGAVGAVAESNLLKLFSKNHKPKTADQDGMLDFLLEFRDFIAKRTGRSDYKIENHYFLAMDGKVFQVMEMDVMERSDFWAIGSGMFLAISALHLGANTEKAIEVAKQYDLFCGGDTLTLTI